MESLVSLAAVVVVVVGLAVLSQWLLDAPVFEPGAASWITSDAASNSSRDKAARRRARRIALTLLVPSFSLAAAAVLVLTTPFDVWVWGVVMLLAGTVATAPVLAVYHYDVRTPTPTEARKLHGSNLDIECDVLVVADATAGTVNGYAIGGPFRDVVGISEFALRTLPPEQIAALLAHEACHHRERHVLVRGAVSVTVLGVGAAVTTILFDALVPPAAVILLSTVLVERVIGYRVMRWLEYRADSAAVTRTSVEKVASLLSTLDDATHANRTKTPILTTVFSTHPTVAARIARIRR